METIAPRNQSCVQCVSHNLVKAPSRDRRDIFITIMQHARKHASLLGWRLEAIAIGLEAIALRVEAITLRVEAIPLRLEASPSLLGWRPSLFGWRPSLLGWKPSLLGWRPFHRS